MEDLTLHAFGGNYHLEALKAKYELLKTSIKENIVLTESQKKAELKRAKAQFDIEKRDSKSNLY